MSQRFNEPYQINDVFAGARTTGNGRLVGRVHCDVLPSDSAGQWVLRLDATSTARTTGYEDRVRVGSRATTQIHGDELFVLGATGLAARPATATARTNITYTSIDAEGLPRRRNEATRQTHARRPCAEADSSALAERSTVARLDAEGRKIAAAFNKSYHQSLRDPAILAHRSVPLVRVPATSAALRWECYAARSANFAATPTPPDFNGDSDFALGVAGSALEDQALEALGDRDLSGEELINAIGGLLGGSTKADKTGQDYRVAFAAWPCDVQVVDGQVRARLHITSFAAADVHYPAMVVDVSYNVAERDGNLALVRQGNLRVKPLPQGDDGAKTMSGRQQTLRLAVQRRLGKVFAEELLWPRFALPGATTERSKLRVERVTADGGWLQLVLCPIESDRQQIGRVDVSDAASGVCACCLIWHNMKTRRRCDARARLVALRGRRTRSFPCRSRHSNTTTGPTTLPSTRWLFRLISDSRASSTARRSQQPSTRFGAASVIRRIDRPQHADPAVGSERRPPAIF